MGRPSLAEERIATILAATGRSILTRATGVCH